MNVETTPASQPKNVIITGASLGLGKAMAEKFASQNFNLYLCARKGDRLKEFADELLQKYKTGVFIFAADLADVQQVKAFGNWFLAQNKEADILINNAGSFIPGSIYNEEEGGLEKMIQVNLYSAYHLTRVLLPLMMQRKRGHIFNMCSIASLQAYANGGSYSISKFALMGFSKNLREEMKPYNIKVTSVYPGAVYTNSWAGSGVDPQRIMEPGDIAETVFSAATLSPQACMEDIILRPLAGDL